MERTRTNENGRYCLHLIVWFLDFIKLLYRVKNPDCFKVDWSFNKIFLLIRYILSSCPVFIFFLSFFFFLHLFHFLRDYYFHPFVLEIPAFFHFFFLFLPKQFDFVCSNKDCLVLMDLSGIYFTNCCLIIPTCDTNVWNRHFVSSRVRHFKIEKLRLSTQLHYKLNNEAID